MYGCRNDSATGLVDLSCVGYCDASRITDFVTPHMYTRRLCVSMSEHRLLGLVGEAGAGGDRLTGDLRLLRPRPQSWRGEFEVYRYGWASASFFQTWAVQTTTGSGRLGEAETWAGFGPVHVVADVFVRSVAHGCVVPGVVAVDGHGGVEHPSASL